jgi:hypothetical protein
VIRLQSIQKAGQPETLAVAGEPRLGALDTSVHDRRTPLRKMLRGWNTGFPHRAMVAGSVVDAADISHVRFQPDLTALPIVVNAAALNFAGQNLLTDSAGQLQLTLSFNGAYDDLGQPVLLAMSVARGVDAVAAAEASAEPSLKGEAGTTGGPRGGFDADEPYRPEPSYVEERWYVIQVPDTFTKTVEYIVVNGDEAKKATVADYRASGIKAYAATTSYKTEEEAYAYVERMQAKRMPRNEFPQ